RERRAATTGRVAGEREVVRDLARRVRLVLVDLREREPDDEVGDLAGRLVDESALLRLDVVLAFVRGRRIPELLRVVVVKFLGVDRRYLEPVLAVLQMLHDGLGQ